MTPVAVGAFDALTVPLEPGVTLVEASAGTGKTFAITRLVLRLLLEEKVTELSKILVVTFTEKATQELVTRIRATLREAERVWSDHPPAPQGSNEDLFILRDAFGARGATVIRRALGSLDDLAVSTIHGFCHRVLEESALESRIPFRTTFLEDDTEPFQRAANDWARHRLISSTADAQLVAGRGESPARWVSSLVRPYSRTPDTRVALDDGDPSQRLLADFVRRVHVTFETEKRRRHLMGFDDLLRGVHRVLTEEGPDGALATRIRSRFSAALIDEFQDTDPTQFPIFSTAFAGCPLWLIGDPKQSIYSFRGADVHAYLRAAHSAARRYTLTRNYRSTPAYLAAVSALFTRAPDPFLVSEEEIGFPPVTAAVAHEPPAALGADGGAPLEWWWVDATVGVNGKYVAKDLATGLIVRAIANEIVRLRGGGVSCGTIAVLVRTNVEARAVKLALDRAGVAAVVSADSDVLGSEEGDELIRLAAAIAAPQDGWALRAAMATRLWGADAAEIAAIQRDDDDAPWAAVVERFTRAREQWWTRGVAVALGELLAERATAERLLGLPDGERRLTNVRHLLELFHEGWAEEGIAPEGFAAWAARERTVPNTPERRELRLESDADAVQIMTIHKCKGLQFGVVFCPTLWQTRAARSGPLGVEFALAPDVDGAVLDLGSPDLAERRRRASEETRAENLRLAYVALTRAVFRCYVAWGAIGQAPEESALGHLLRSTAGEDRRAVLDSLVAGAGGTMRVREITRDEPMLHAHEHRVPSVGFDAPALSLGARQLESWRISSFTGLTTGAHANGDRDSDDPILVPDLPQTPGATPGFRGFPPGAQSGNALHAVLESLDFGTAADGGVAVVVRRELQAHSLLGAGDAAERRVGDVVAMLRALSGAPIPDAGFTLRDVPIAAALREWRFDLSLGGFSPARFADAMESHGSAHARAYAPALRALGGQAFDGYLAGFVDIAFEHDGRWWLMDWKSNWLGPSDADYAAPSLDLAMREAHYTLQYHLYLVALHRHLRARQPGYDPRRHWGGVAYVFLRGIGAAGSLGWFRDMPSAALLEALDTAVGERV